MSSNSLDRQIIIENYKNPYNFKKPDKFDRHGESINWSCGDEISIYLQLDETKTKISDAYFSGQGCALSVASSSILIQEIVNKDLEYAAGLELEFLEEQVGSEFSINRKKCVNLPILALKSAIGQDKKED